jgi:hypothetical protein
MPVKALIPVPVLALLMVPLEALLLVLVSLAVLPEPEVFLHKPYNSLLSQINKLSFQYHTDVQ